MKIFCWNVNGIRAALRKDFEESVRAFDPDVICIQESKIRPEQITEEMRSLFGFESEWVCADRPGYSGVATFFKKKPKSVQHELGGGQHDDEGRLVLTEFEGFTLVNVYIPNGGRGDHRVQYKLNYYDEMLDLLEKLRSEGHNLVICGDFNTAHTEIDLARPKENVNVTGFLPVERAWLDKFVAAGYVDTWRALHPDARDVYSWWSYRSAARKRNVGWRIDYFFVNEEFMPKVKRSEVLMDVLGSDHCPLLLELDL